MYRIMFVCHGNICRSPMAEFVLKDMVKKRGIEDNFFIKSSATSCEEIGNPVHRGTRAKLSEFGITCEGKRAVRLRADDYEKYDMFIGMDSYNLINMQKIFGGDKDHKIYSMLEFTGSTADVADPWYTGDFDKTYEDIKAGCEALLEKFRI